MIDPSNIGRSFGPYTIRVEREQIRRLATALGETSRVYFEPETALAAGLPDLPAPPTLATCYGLWANPALLAELEDLGAALPRLLHGEQHYSYHAPIYAGDTLVGSPTIVSLEEKSGSSGPFELLTLETRWHKLRENAGEPMLTIVDRLVVVVRGA